MTERTDIYAYEDGDEYVVEWGGRRFSAAIPFGLDSQLSDAGLPWPRNLHLVDRETAVARNRLTREQTEEAERG